MAAFPDPAQRVEHNDNFLAFDLSMVDAPLSAVVLIQIRPNGVVADHSRIHIFGSVNLDIYFVASDLFSFPEAEGLLLHTCSRPDGVGILLDRTTSAFMDVQAALQDRSIEIVISTACPSRPKTSAKSCAVRATRGTPSAALFAGHWPFGKGRQSSSYKDSQCR